MTNTTTNEDLKKAFDDHAKHDEVFQDETRETDRNIQSLLTDIGEKITAMERKFDNRLANIEEKFNPKSTNYFFLKMDLMYSIYEGWGFSEKLVVKLGVIAGSIGAIIATVKYLK